MAPDASHGPARNAALDRIKNVVGEKGWSDDLNDHVSYVNAFRGGWEGKTALLVRPASTHEVSEVMTICADAKTPVVPQVVIRVSLVPVCRMPAANRFCSRSTG